MSRMPQERYVEALKRQQARIQGGLKLDAVDCTAAGMKSTSCTWGLCSDEKEAWPDAQDHLWPDQFLERGRVAPLYREKTQLCPLDRREPGQEIMNGCFYTCMVFSRGEEPRPSREQVIKLYDKRLEQAGAPRLSNADHQTPAQLQDKGGRLGGLHMP